MGLSGPGPHSISNGKATVFAARPRGRPSCIFTSNALPMLLPARSAIVVATCTRWVPGRQGRARTSGQ
jgi:hypothetical protein